MQTKTVELSVLLSLVHGYEILDVTNRDVIEVVSHVHGKTPEEVNTPSMFESATKHILDKHPKLAEAARLVRNLPPDEGRYNKLIDLTKKWFHIEPMTSLQPT